MSRTAIAFLGLALLIGAAPVAQAETSYPRSMVWYAETMDGKVVSQHKADEPVNPASVVKVATSLRALDLLGPEHRFDTVFRYAGGIEADWPPESGELAGDIVVLGGADPDFQLENAFMLALWLNKTGIHAIRGRLLVDDRFWIGWEKGSAGRLEDQDERSRLMASRLRSALDSHRWDRRTQKAWKKYAGEFELNAGKPPRLLVKGGYGRFEGEQIGTVLVTHRSKPLVDLLRRFNAFSNNDIERLDASIGSPAELASWLNGHSNGEPVVLQTSSGLGVNRMSPRQVVKLVRDLMFQCNNLGIDLARMLPASGCRPGTLSSMYPRLKEGEYRGSITGKTGTLIHTDGGVSVLAGVADTRQGKVIFCVAYERAGRNRYWARKQEEAWLLELVRSLGGPIGRTCPDGFPGPHHGAELL
ncbi:MAG: D-alanyl-D-alanine carboxypeptidase [Acidobacteria bacterium]|uniref:D-alanyl-D-alanine carboxypeptidase n=1 Tax=Candidatus Polarisedimenticola svalbardensis TaxID=2886004 RepID=A0A8J6Y2N1_9BACT|nr:D-alanyl-D-alanine carboxypeptidase [Candidatus Polarisedimenticola svalbardensis]